MKNLLLLITAIAMVSCSYKPDREYEYPAMNLEQRQERIDARELDVAQTAWNIFGTIAVMGMVLSFFAGRNAIWGAATFGLFIALIWCTILYFVNGDFNWSFFRGIMIVAIDLGIVATILGILGRQ